MTIEDHLITTGGHQVAREKDPQDSLKMLRRVDLVISGSLGTTGVILMAVAAWQGHYLPIWNLGLTMLGICGMAATAASVCYVGIVVIGHARRSRSKLMWALRRENKLLHAGLEEQRAEWERARAERAEHAARIEAIEVAVQAIEAAVRELADLITARNDLEQRRRFGGQ